MGLGRPAVEKSNRELRGRCIDIQNVIDELKSNQCNVSIEEASHIHEPKTVNSNLERFWLIGPISSRFWGSGDLHRNIRNRDPNLLLRDADNKWCALGSIIVVCLQELKEELESRIQPPILELASVPLQQSFIDMAYAALIRLTPTERGMIYKRVETCSKMT